MTNKKKRAKKPTAATTHSIFKRIPAIRDADARIELGRAHLLVALLAAALCLMLLMNLQPDYAPNATLSALAAVLLVIVSLFSLSVAVRLYTKR